jgi:AraC-like DNA-binding protein
MTPPPKNMIAGNIPPGPTVGAGYARALLDFATRRGADRAMLMAAARIGEAILDDADQRLPFSAFVSLMREAKRACNNPALALHFGEGIDMAEFSIVGLICNAAPTMQHAFAEMNRYGRLVVEVDGVGEGPRFTLEPDAQGLWVVDRRSDPNAFPELTESTFARMAAHPRAFGVEQLMLEVQVTHPRPDHVAEYERILRAPVTFNASRNAYLLDTRYLHHPIALQPRYVFGVLSEHAQGLMNHLEQSRTTRGRVEAQLLPSLHTGAANIDTIARTLGMSRQTLYRRLKEEGATFAEVLESLRHRMALHYLQGRNVSVNETAYLVGFSDPAAFSRAFKRWTGKSPKAMRESKQP